MNKTLTCAIILASSFLLSACGVKNDDSSTTKESKTSFSLRELIAQNIPQKCIYSGTNENGAFESEIIVSGDKFNQTVKFTSGEEGESTFNTISDGEYFYTWGVSQGQTFATKMKADVGTNDQDDQDDQDYQTEEGSFDQENSIDLDDDFQGTCVPTMVSDKDFQPPTDIDFTDYSQLMEQWQNMDTSDFMNLE